MPIYNMSSRSPCTQRAASLGLLSLQPPRKYIQCFSRVDASDNFPVVLIGPSSMQSSGSQLITRPVFKPKYTAFLFSFFFLFSLGTDTYMYLYTCHNRRAQIRDDGVPGWDGTERRAVFDPSG